MKFSFSDSVIRDFSIRSGVPIVEALKKIDANRQGFVIVVDEEDRVLGVLTDGDIRRAFLGGLLPDRMVDLAYTRDARVLRAADSFELVIELFKNPRIKFLPVVDEDGRLVNVITKEQMHTLLLQDIHPDLGYDFSKLDTTVLESEIFQRPWGFYKTIVLNDFYQGKVISVKPGGKLSLQSHHHREEHWIVVHGTGTVQLDDSVLTVRCGSSVFIPKGCRHRLANEDEKENLIIAEVQIGDYLGEDDIIRYEDIYGRA